MFSLLEVISALAALIISYMLVGALYCAVKHDSAIVLWAIFTLLVFLSVLAMA